MQSNPSKRNRRIKKIRSIKKIKERRKIKRNNQLLHQNLKHQSQNNLKVQLNLNNKNQICKL